MTKRAFYLGLILLVSFFAMIISLADQYSPRPEHYALFAIFGLVMVVCVCKVWKGGFADEKQEDIQPASLLFGKSKLFRVVFVSFGVAFGLSLLMLIFSFFIYDSAAIVSYVSKYFLLHLLVVAVFCIPLTSKFMKS